MSKEPWREYISLEEVVRLHAEGINLYGGMPSKPRPGCVEGAIGNAYTASLYGIGENEPTPTSIALILAGYLLFYLASDHCFIEGNKRVAWTSCIHILAYLELTVAADWDEAFNLCDAIIKREVKSGHEVVDWLSERLTSFEDAT